MLNTTKKNPINLVRYPSEVVYTFVNYEQFLHYWPMIRNYDIGHGFYCFSDIFTKHYQYAIRDSFGDFLDPQKIHNDYNARHQYKRTMRCSQQAYGSFRRIRTFQERRWFHAWDDEEFAPKGRLSRSVRNLPDSWDDFISHNEKCWKRHRKTQWK